MLIMSQNYNRSQDTESIVLKTVNQLPSSDSLKTIYPISDIGKKNKQARDDQVANILAGKDSRLFIIIGPCSADYEDSILEYVLRLKRLQEDVKERVFLMPRVYTNKPRTSGIGYKGMLYYPDPKGSANIRQGLDKVRRMHVRILNETSFTCADELLYTNSYSYLSDLISYVAVGARTVESQEHRLFASSLAIPVGMKNPQGGNLTAMLNSVEAAQRPHKFIFQGCEVESNGNIYTHAVLRGCLDRKNRMISNYQYHHLKKFCEEYQNRNLKNMAIIVDASHANSGKDYSRQPEVCLDVLHSRKRNNAIKSMIKGFMIESYLQDGSQEVEGSDYGKSITDPCLGWDKSRELVLRIADLWQ